jgi:O-antigen/teichoic acid export membrane protein
MVLPVTLIASYGTGVLLAKQDIQKIAISNLISKSLYLLLLLPLFFINRALVAYALIALITSFAINAAYIALIVRRYGQIKPAYIPGIPVEFIKKGVVYALALFVLSLNYRVDVVILERLSSTYEVGIYSIGVTIAELLWILPTALTTVNFARSASAKNALSYSKKTALVLRLTLVLTLLPVLGLYLLSPWVIPLFYGADFAAGGFVVQAILPGVWLSVIFKVLNSDLAGRGRPDAALWVYILAVAINVVLNVMWAPRYGALGSAWASSVSYSVGAIIFAVAYARMSHVSFRELFVPRVEDFRRLLGAAR